MIQAIHNTRVLSVALSTWCNALGRSLHTVYNVLHAS